MTFWVYVEFVNVVGVELFACGKHRNVSLLVAWVGSCVGLVVNLCLLETFYRGADHVAFSRIGEV